MQIGRLDRSAFLACYYHSQLFGRKINTQLNRQESRHELDRRIFYGQKGELRQKYKEGQEAQLSALGLVLHLSLIPISEPTRLLSRSYALFFLKKKN